MRPALVLVVVLLLAPAVGAQGLLERSRVDPPRTPPAEDRGSSKPSEAHADSTPSCFDDPVAEVFGGLFAMVVAAPVLGPMALLEDDWTRSAVFPGHPYARRDGGFLDPSLDPDTSRTSSFLDPRYLKPWTARLLLENGNNFHGLNRTGAHLFFDTGSRFGISSRWDHYRERLGCGCWDYTTLGDAHLTVRFAQSRHAEFHAGLGARWRFDHSDTSGGVSFLYGANFYPIDPLVVSASIDLGNLDRQFVFRARASAGWQIGRCELLGGYDFLRLGSVNLQGPFLGLRLWF